MNITLLGHHDIASLYALDRVVRSLPEHQYTVLLSSAAEIDPTDRSPLDELAAFDASLCDSFLAGDIVGKVVLPLSVGTAGSLEDPNAREGLVELGKLQPDLVISIRYRRILRDDAIAIPRLGVLNLHSGILPAYRGVMATFWAMLNSEKEIGTTLHWIVDSGIDTGPVISITRRATRPSHSYLANVLGLYADGCAEIAQAVRAIARDEPLLASSQAKNGQYFAAPGAADVQRFESQQLTLFGHGDAAEICTE